MCHVTYQSMRLDQTRLWHPFCVSIISSHFDCKLFTKRRLLASWPQMILWGVRVSDKPRSSRTASVIMILTKLHWSYESHEMGSISVFWRLIMGRSQKLHDLRSQKSKVWDIPTSCRHRYLITIYDFQVTPSITVALAAQACQNASGDEVTYCDLVTWPWVTQGSKFLLRVRNWWENRYVKFLCTPKNMHAAPPLSSCYLRKADGADDSPSPSKGGDK